MENKSSFFIVGKHAVTEALKNPKRKVIRLFLTEESKKSINRATANNNLLKDKKIHFKTKREMDKYCGKELIQHQGYLAEVEHLDKLELKEFVKNCMKEMTKDNPDEYPGDLVINNIFFDIYQDDELNINRIYNEIKLFQENNNDT